MTENKEILDIYQILEKKNYTPRKWELIERILVFCEPSTMSINDMKRYHRATALADEIDEALEMYELQVTEDWVTYWKELKPLIISQVESNDYASLLERIRTVHSCSNFCIACYYADEHVKGLEEDGHEPDNMCYTCEYGNEHGVCDMTESQYSDFASAFNNALGIVNH